MENPDWQIAQLTYEMHWEHPAKNDEHSRQDNPFGVIER